MSNPRFIFIPPAEVVDQIFCEDCGELVNIEIRRYHDQNLDPNLGDIVETSVRASCYCVKERDIYREQVFDDTMVNVSRGRPGQN